jgi:hypothetical protein
MVLMISYDLNRHERPSAYQEVHDVIKRRAVSYRRPLYSQWFVETNYSRDDWSAAIRAVIDEDDSLLVVQVRWPYQGWLAKEIWTWLNARA